MFDYLFFSVAMFGFCFGICADEFEAQPLETTVICFGLGLIWPLVFAYALYQKAKWFLDYRSILKDKDGR